jgi:hypothetical protein
MQDLPRPSWLLIVNSLILISICIFFFSIALGGIIALPDPCSVAGGLIVLLPSLGIGVSEYIAVFRRNAKAAQLAGVFLFLAGGLLLFGVVMNFGEWIIKSPVRNTSFFIILSCLLFFGGYILFCGWQLWRWAKKCRTQQIVPSLANVLPNDGSKLPANSPHLSPPFQFSLRELLGFVAVIAAISSITTWTIRSEPPKFIEHATAEQAMLSLPKSASDVCCARASRGTITYEFSIDEKGFFDWVNSGLGTSESKAEGIDVQPVHDVFSILRYTNWRPRVATGPQDVVKITHGYCYSWSKEDRCVIYAYDKDNRRAYYFYCLISID